MKPERPNSKVQHSKAENVQRVITQRLRNREGVRLRHEILSTYLQEFTHRGNAGEGDFGIFDERRRGGPQDFAEAWKLAYQHALQLNYEHPMSAFALAERVASIEGRQERQEHLMQYAIQPVLKKMARVVEYTSAMDELPAAASAQYEIHSQVSECVSTIEELSTVFQDLRERLSIYTVLQEQFRELLKSSRVTGNKNFRNGVLTIYDAIHGIYSENLTIEQVQVLHDSIQRLSTVNWERDEVRSLDESLRKVGFETVPSDQFRYAQDV